MLTKQDLKDISKLLKAQLKPIKSDLGKVRKNQDKIIDFFDKANLEIKKRIEQIEEKLGSFPS